MGGADTVVRRPRLSAVEPPLLEFEDTLLAGSGVAVADQTFRLMDPDSQRMMGLRADTTPQVARIATTRLGGAPRRCACPMPASACGCGAASSRRTGKWRRRGWN